MDIYIALLKPNRSTFSAFQLEENSKIWSERERDKERGAERIDERKREVRFPSTGLEPGDSLSSHLLAALYKCSEWVNKWTNEWINEWFLWWAWPQFPAPANSFCTFRPFPALPFHLSLDVSLYSFVQFVPLLVHQFQQPTEAVINRFIHLLILLLIHPQSSRTWLLKCIEM